MVTVRAGTPLADLEAALAEHGQCLPFEPPRFAAGGTVGGMVAAGLSGPARASAGSVRDHVLGATLLNGRRRDLELRRPGCKERGRLRRVAPDRRILGNSGRHLRGVAQGVARVPLGATLRFDCDESQALAWLRQWASQPLPINGSSWHDGRLHVRLAGAAAAVSAACGRIGGAALDPEAAAAWWLGLRDQTAEFFSIAESSLQRGECLWRLSVPGTAAADTCRDDSSSNGTAPSAGGAPRADGRMVRAAPRPRAVMRRWCAPRTSLRECSRR